MGIGTTDQKTGRFKKSQKPKSWFESWDLAIQKLPMGKKDNLKKENKKLEKIQ